MVNPAEIPKQMANFDNDDLGIAVLRLENYILSEIYGI